MNENNITKHILLIDDDETHLFETESMLKDKYDVCTVKSGRAALLRLIKGPVPNLILLDILMPQMDGWETFRTIKGITLLHDIPIAFITSLTDSSEAEQAFQMGAVDFIMKPYGKEELIKRIDSIFEKFGKKT